MVHPPTAPQDAGSLFPFSAGGPKGREGLTGDLIPREAAAWPREWGLSSRSPLMGFSSLPAVTLLRPAPCGVRHRAQSVHRSRQLLPQGTEQREPNYCKIIDSMSEGVANRRDSLSLAARVRCRTRTPRPHTQIRQRPPRSQTQNRSMIRFLARPDRRSDDQSRQPPGDAPTGSAGRNPPRPLKPDGPIPACGTAYGDPRAALNGMETWV